MDDIHDSTTQGVPPDPTLEAIDAWLAQQHDARLWNDARLALSAPDGPRASDEVRAARDKLAEAWAQLAAALEGDDEARQLRAKQDYNIASEAALASLEAARPLDIRSKRSTPPSRAWLVESRIPAHRYGMITGTGGNGKSYVMLALARAMANPERWDILPPGEDPPIWIDWPIQEGGPVIWLTWEDEPEEIDRRLGRDGRADVGEALHVVDLAEHGPLWAPKPSGSGHTSTVAGLTPTGRAVRSLAETKGAALLVVDPLAAAFVSNENDRGLVRAFASSWDGWARRVRCTAAMIAHPSKDREHTYSGNTDWQASSRWMLHVRGVTDQDSAHGDNGRPNLRVLDWAKANYGPKAESVYLKWEDGAGYVYAGDWRAKSKSKPRNQGKPAV